MTAQKSTLKKGSTVIYPQTTDDMVYIEGDANNRTMRNVVQEVSQLGQEVDGYDTIIPISADTTVTGFGMSTGGEITDSARTDYSVKIYKITFGKTYHVVIPKLTNAYTAALGFLNDTDAASPKYKTATLTDPVVRGPLTDYETNITAPSDTLINLVVVYETSYGIPTITTQIHTDGIVEKIEDIEQDVLDIQGDILQIQQDIEGAQSDIDDIQGDIEDITTNLDETEYINTGEWEHYVEIGKYCGWKGTGTHTPVLEEAVSINCISFPTFYVSAESSVKYCIGYRTSVATGFTPSIDTTIVKTGTFTNIQGYQNGIKIYLDEPITIPSGNSLFVLLYVDSRASEVLILGGGADATETLPYNANTPRAYILSGTGYWDNPWSESWAVASDANGTDRWKVCSPILKLEQISLIDQRINVTVPGIVEEITDNEKTVNVYLPSRIYAVVGDTLQIFFQGIVAAINLASYDIYAECVKGKTFPRYFSYTPAAADIGTVTFTVYVKDRNNNVLGQASCDLVTVAAPTSPVLSKSIFTIGDSLITGGQWPGEAKRRLVGSSTYDSITGAGLSNIEFYGYMNKVINGQSVDYFGVGGWNWLNYEIKSAGGAFRFFVSGVSLLKEGAEYTNNGFTYTIQEINITEGIGNIRCTTSSNTNAPTSSGVLTKSSGDGDATISFESFETENANPLWDDTNNKMSFIPYVQNCGASTVDAVYVLLGWNDMSAWNTYSGSAETGSIYRAKVFARTLHSEFPSAKLFIMGLQMPSILGGLGSSYGASGGKEDQYGVCQAVFSYNVALKDMCELPEFSGYCEFVPIAPQFDSLYNMQYADTKVNLRNSKTEMIGTNGVHPADSGYFQIADAVYRSIVANFCQSE